MPAEAVRPPFQMGEAPAEMPRIVDRMVLPSTLKDLQPSRLRWLTPGIRHSTLWRDDFSTLHFIRVNAGVKLPAHSHRGLELTCVLRGRPFGITMAYILSATWQRKTKIMAKQRSGANTIILSELNRKKAARAFWRRPVVFTSAIG